MSYIRSTDDGYTWSAPVYLPAGLLGPSKNKPIILSNGDILCGTSAETWNSWSCWLERSCDAGVTWEKHGPICAPCGSDAALPPAVSHGAGIRSLQPDNFAGVIQPAIWEYAPGRLKMLMRATRRVGTYLPVNLGRHGLYLESGAATELENPNSGLDAVRLTDGRVVVVYNPSQSDRSPLAIALSEDNGETWPYSRFLETEAGEFSYPAIIQSADGILHVTYSCWRNHIQHVTLEPEWIQAGR